MADVIYVVMEWSMWYADVDMSFTTDAYVLM